jgi:5'(3')-deoxyribonucleotidase
MKRIVYIDMDNVIVDFVSGINRLSAKTQREYEGRLDDVPGIFALMDPMPGAVQSVTELHSKFDVYALSTAPWANPSAWSDKVAWIQKHFGSSPTAPLHKRLILTHHKHLNTGDYLIDDRTRNGADRFKGQHIHFGQPEWPNWEVVTRFLMST